MARPGLRPTTQQRTEAEHQMIDYARRMRKQAEVYRKALTLIANGHDDPRFVAAAALKEGNEQ